VIAIVELDQLGPAPKNAEHSDDHRTFGLALPHLKTALWALGPLMDGEDTALGALLCFQ
jgi:hypothetical protein